MVLRRPLACTLSGLIARTPSAKTVSRLERARTPEATASPLLPVCEDSTLPHWQLWSDRSTAMEAAPPGSRDGGDPLTTNVHIANLPHEISDLALGSFCASRFGPVASLKARPRAPETRTPLTAAQIMWPRPGHELGPGQGFAMRQRQGLNGFVAFMRSVVIAACAGITLTLRSFKADRRREGVPRARRLRLGR